MVLRHEAKNNTLEEIANLLKGAGSALVFPHVSADGDTLGSAVALCAAMRKLGKESYVVMEDKIPDMIAFLSGNFCVYDQRAIERPDVCVMVDCGEWSRIPRRRALFEAGRHGVCIDHHVTTAPFLEWNHIDSRASAAAEIIHDLIILMGVEPDAVIMEAICAGIITDTGKFQYANTGARAHRIMAEFYDRGFSPSDVCVRLYQNNRLEKELLESKALARAKFLAGGRAAVATVTREMLEECGAMWEDADGVVEKLRDIKGVEVAAVIKKKRGEHKVSLRSKLSFDAAAFAETRSGGGHLRAAGYALRESYEYVEADLIGALEAYLAGKDG
ncbi:MAG: bifunctional oligoribonuclease/PAP phosphatase NrnA [Clostridiales Family XIII bacterium]|jgi:phosphoesterase RecJ-like protein|nr:bifunctional oligoribonuclease/PAP phosphatase NrnA [Clostridiales Family XIII bacterium]